VIKAKFFREGDGEVTRFEVIGHSGYAERGKDIVCSAVSALVQATIMGLERHAGIQLQGEISDGSVRCVLPEGAAGSVAVHALVETLVTALEDIARQCPGFVSVQTERADGAE